MENINITLQEPNIANVDSVLSGPPGPQGEPGTPGRDGVSPTINIGTVTTLPAGSPATVTNSGSESSVILDFGLPQGEQGVAGTPGEDGADGVDGVSPTISIGTTSTLEPDQQAYVSNVGTPTNVVLNFGIPQGIQGDNANCLSVPTIVDSLPAVGDPQVFYFVPIIDTTTTVTGSSVNLTVSADKVGRIKDLEIEGNIEQSTPPATPEALRGVITFTINSEDYTVDLGDIYLAKVTTHQDKIFNIGDEFFIHREIGYIESYTDEDLTGVDYISTSGTLTPGDEVYYDLQDPTDTLIEDENLINALRIIRNQVLPVGTNTISTSADVTANISVEYYNVDPYHQYDKYVYMIDTANYEKVG